MIPRMSELSGELPSRPNRKHDLETGPVRHRRFVDDVSAVGASVGSGDREPETRAVRSGLRLRASREPVEQARYELAANTFAPIFDGKTQVRIATRGRDGDRRLAVPQRVRDQVREHAVERGRIDDGLEIRGNGNRHRVPASTCGDRNELLDPRP